jgi:hypothetical protein
VLGRLACCRLARRGRLLQRLGERAVYDENLADLLHRMRVQDRADLREESLACIAIVGGSLYLDQFVAFEIDVDLAEHRRGQSLVADGDHRMQGMRARLEGFSLRRSERGGMGRWRVHALF